jgi:hypothetical protein
MILVMCSSLVMAVQRVTTGNEGNPPRELTSSWRDCCKTRLCADRIELPHFQKFIRLIRRSGRDAKGLGDVSRAREERVR